jgi:hypothetical protein
MNLTRSEYQTLLRRDLNAFVERSFYELNPATPFLPNWHLELVASKLEACRRGEITRLIINQPPRSLKSHMASVAFVAFLLGTIRLPKLFVPPTAGSLPTSMHSTAAESWPVPGTKASFLKLGFRPSIKPWMSSKRPERD